MKSWEVSDLEWLRACEIRPEDGPLLREIKEILAESIAAPGAEIIKFPGKLEGGGAD